MPTSGLFWRSTVGSNRVCTCTRRFEMWQQRAGLGNAPLTILEEFARISPMTSSCRLQRLHRLPRQEALGRHEAEAVEERGLSGVGLNDAPEPDLSVRSAAPPADSAPTVKAGEDRLSASGVYVGFQLNHIGDTRREPRSRTRSLTTARKSICDKRRAPRGGQSRRRG